MGKGHVYQQQFYGGGGDGIWMESQAQQNYAFHEEYMGPEYSGHHHMHMKPPHHGAFPMENHGHGYGHGHGMLTKPGTGYHHAYGGDAAGGMFSNGGGNKFNRHHSGYDNSYSEEHEEFEYYGEGGAVNHMHVNHEMRNGHGNSSYPRMKNMMNYMGHKPHGGHKFEWTSKGV